ncbi:MAG: cadherin-like beta sandwich domain-containing protein [bacterium]|nr:cadherin-like beta sandwich domain-containing protein [bacterium]
MKKNFKISLFLILLNLCMLNIKAASMTINSSSGTVTVGSTVAVTLSCDSLMGSFSIKSSDSEILYGGPKDPGWCENSVFSEGLNKTVYFTAKSPGTATITYSTVNVSDESFKPYSGSRSVTINVVAKNSNTNKKGQVDINKTYSSNNYLSSLSIEGYDISPEFNKDVLQYSVTLPSEVDVINVNASKEDDAANIIGIGEVQVSEGANEINVVVTAENGNERTYKIIANVVDDNPIKAKIGKNSYTVIKKEKLLPPKDGYELKKIKIDGTSVPSLYNSVTKVTLVGLKDENGNIELYSYDTSNGKYQIYSEFKFDIMNLYIHEKKNSKYEKKNIKIGDKKIIGYKINGTDDYYLLYATNTVTGYEGYYLYDVKENSVQRYDTTMLDKINNEKDKYLAIVLVLSCVCFLSMLFLLIEVNKTSK